jgi:hypothetical protein
MFNNQALRQSECIFFLIGIVGGGIQTGRFSPSISVSPAKTVHSTNDSINTIARGS